MPKFTFAINHPGGEVKDHEVEAEDVREAWDGLLDDLERQGDDLEEVAIRISDVEDEDEESSDD